jgi:hypothetical protein
MSKLSVKKEPGWLSHYCDKATGWTAKESRFDSEQGQRVFPALKYEDCL